MWLPRLMRAVDEQQHHQCFGIDGDFIPCQCHRHRPPSTLIINPLDSAWRLIVFKYLAILVLLVLVVFIGLTTRMNDLSTAASLFSLIVIGAVVLFSSLVCCLRTRALCHTNNTNIQQQQQQTHTLVVIRRPPTNTTIPHTIIDGRRLFAAAAASDHSPCSLRAPLTWSSSVVDDGPPSYDDAIKDERWQCTSGDHQPPPMYTESENDTIQQQPNDDHAVVVMPTVADDEHTHQSSASD